MSPPCQAPPPPPSPSCEPPASAAPKAQGPRSAARSALPASPRASHRALSPAPHPAELPLPPLRFLCLPRPAPKATPPRFEGDPDLPHPVARRGPFDASARPQRATPHLRPASYRPRRRLRRKGRAALPVLPCPRPRGHPTARPLPHPTPPITPSTPSLAPCKPRSLHPPRPPNLFPIACAGGSGCTTGRMTGAPRGWVFAQGALVVVGLWRRLGEPSDC